MFYSLFLYTTFQLAAFLTTPFDVIKTHKQIEFGERFLYPGNNPLLYRTS